MFSQNLRYPAPPPHRSHMICSPYIPPCRRNRNKSRRRHCIECKINERPRKRQQCSTVYLGQHSHQLSPSQRYDTLALPEWLQRNRDNSFDRLQQNIRHAHGTPERSYNVADRKVQVLTPYIFNRGRLQLGAPPADDIKCVAGELAIDTIGPSRSLPILRRIFVCEGRS